jgi:hypothetical protein
MAVAQSPKIVAEIRRSLAELVRRIEIMCLKLEAFEQWLRRRLRQTSGADEPGGPAELFEIAYQELRAKAERGVDSVIINRSATGTPALGKARSVPVKLGEYGETQLTPAEADLLEVLCIDAPSDDGLVGYKDLSELSRLLRERCGRNLQAASLRNLICRLRTTLELRKQNWYLVQTSAGPRYRFALRHGGLFRVI